MQNLQQEVDESDREGEEEDSVPLDKQIQDEYVTWKENVPFLYDICLTQKLSWPSLTVQWLPEVEIDENDNEIHKLLVGTNTSSQEQNYLRVISIILPKVIDDTMDTTLITNLRKIQGVGEIKEVVQVPHEGEVNRARAMPQSSNIVATWSPSGLINIFNFNTEQVDGPSIKLQYHKNEGYGLSWSQLTEGALLSAGYDRHIALWDIKSQSQRPVREYKFHTKEAEDVCWHIKNPYIFASCSDDCTVAIVDIRVDQPVNRFKPHSQEVNQVQFNPGHEHLFITGSNDNSIKLFDFRKPDQELHTFDQHEEPVYSLQWAVHDKRFFASGSSDRRIIIWDMAKIGSEIKAEDEKDGPAEMLFIHAGHQSKINDLSWNQKMNFVISSVEETTNVLQVWRMQRTVMEEEDEDDQMIMEEIEIQL